MKARLLAYWDDLASSYWFIPSVMTLGAIALSFGLTQLDAFVGGDWIESTSWIYANKPAGARTLLSTVAGSMIGVAGVSFSITVASVVYASGQYGPRLLTNFMSDRGNQITLGTFIATYIYCLLVLRTIRASDEVPSVGALPEDFAVAFVPHIAVLAAVGLALASIAVFIYFIHHIPHSIHVSNVIAEVGEELQSKIETLFPGRIGEGAPGEDALESDEVRTKMPENFYDAAEAIKADGSGYIQGIDGAALLNLASEQDLLLVVSHRPGDFVSPGDPLVLAWPVSRLREDTRGRLRLAFAWGRQRTARQDMRFLINELVEIAARALSPGVNDPFTAMGCLDWLGGALKCLAERDIPSANRYDEDGALRVVAEPTLYKEFIEHVFAQLRPYLAADRNAALHALEVIGQLARGVSDDDRRAALREEADALLQGTEAVLSVEADRQAIRTRHRVVARLLSGQETMSR